MEDFMKDLIEVQRLNTKNLHECAKIDKIKRKIVEEQAERIRLSDLIDREMRMKQIQIETDEEDRVRRKRWDDEERKRCDDMTNAGNMAAIMACLF